MDSYDTVFENRIFPLEIGVSAELAVLGRGELIEVFILRPKT